jgi:hypothetical protein
MSGNGWCTHPDRQVSSDVRILVRKNELACRNAWGSDLWQDASSPESAATPPAGNQPASTPPSPVPMNIAYDDEVTSVVSSDQHRTARNEALDDEVVEQSVINFSDDYADEEQEERRNLLYRGSGREVIQRARERASSKRQPPMVESEVPVSGPDEDDDVVISEADESGTRVAASLREPVFEPDDFVEDENPTAEKVVDEHDDALLSEGIRTITPREARLRRFRDERPAPKEPATTKTEPAPDDVELALPPSAAPERGRFDSIPEISAEIDLPLLRRHSSATTQPAAAPVQGAELHEDDAASYERALKRARALNASARAEENASRRPTTVPMAPRQQPSAGPTIVMPDLPDDDADFAAGPGKAASAAPMRKKTMDKPQPTPEARVRKPLLAASRQDQQRTTRTDDPRRSWWRGNRTAADEEMASASMEADVDDIHTVPDALPPYEAEPHHAASMPLVNLDLERQEDLEAFRDRLFASSSPRDGAEATPEHVSRSPITATRRQRPISPAARERYRAERTPQEQASPATFRMAEADEPQHEARPSKRPQRPRPEAPGVQREPRQLRPRERRIEPEELLADPEDAWYEPMPEPEFDVRSLIERDTELLDMTIEIAPDVPRACATCRNYRPSEQPGRGWCTNTWAFTHRQMVNETDIACDSTIGCWWLPADEEVWLTELDIASEATPRVDRLIAHLDPERRVAGS